jgi:hypothetical protein
MAVIFDTTTAGIINLKFDKPFRTKYGVDERELVKAIINPAPLIKSILNGKKAAARGTKSTPPPTPLIGDRIPIMKVNTNNITIHCMTDRSTITKPVFF